MTQRRITQWLISASLIAALLPCSADDSRHKAGKAEAEANSPQWKSVAQVYTPPPPPNPKPLVKVTVGAPRGSHLDIDLSLLIPADRILTWNDPTLTWEISRDIDKPVRLIIADPDQTEPLYDRVISPRAQAGRHTIRFSKLGIQITPGARYECTLCVSLKGGCSIARDLVAITELVMPQP